MNILLCGEVVTACSGCLGGQRKAAGRCGGKTGSNPRERC